MSKAESVLKHLCDKVVDVIHETFTTKYYIVGISQAKNGNIYLIVRKKMPAAWWRTNLFLRKDWRDCYDRFFMVQEKNHIYLEIILLTLNWSGAVLDITSMFYSFVGINMSTAFFDRKQLEVIYFYPHTLTHYQNLFDTDKKVFFFIYHFKTKFVPVNEKLLVSFLTSFEGRENVLKIRKRFDFFRQFFLRYYIESEGNN